MLLLRKYLILLPKRISIKNQIKLILMSLLLVKLNIFLPLLNPNGGTCKVPILISLDFTKKIMILSFASDHTI